MSKTMRLSRPPVDTESVLTALGVRVARVGDREISAHCPFHTDNHPSFSMNIATGLFICFQCGRKGTLEWLIQEVGSGRGARSLLRAVRLRSVGLEAGRQRAAEKSEEDDTSTPLLVRAEYESFSLPPAWALSSRELSPEATSYYGLRWNHGWVMPIWSPDLTGNPDDLWGWQFKRLDFVSNYPKGVQKSQTFFGLREFRGGRAILVESPLDVVRLASENISGGLAAFGAMVSAAQVQLLIERADRVVLALDNDMAGKTQMRRLLPVLDRYLPTERLSYKGISAKDPGEMRASDLDRLR